METGPTQMNHDDGDRMSVVSYDGEAADQGESAEKPTDCPSCIERDAELKQLRHELAALRSETVQGRQFQWTCILIVGLGLFLTMPLTIYMLSILFTDQFKAEWLDLAFHSLLWSIPISQTCLVALIAIVHWRPRWQRVAAGAAFLLLFIGIGSAPFRASAEEEYRELIRMVIPLLPMTIAISLLPIFVLRMFRRWTITTESPLTPASARPVSLSSYFLLLSLFALASGWLKVVNSDGNFSTIAEAVGGFLIYIGVPGLSTGGLFTVLLPAILQRTGQHPLKWIQRLTAIGLAAAAGPMLLGIAILVVDGQSLSWQVVLYLLTYCLATMSGAFLVATAAIIWLRMLDYRLVAVPRS